MRYYSEKTVKEICELLDKDYEMYLNLQRRPSIDIPKSHSIIRELDEIKKAMLKYGFKAPDMTVHEFVEDEVSVILEASEYKDMILSNADDNSVIDNSMVEFPSIDYPKLNSIPDACKNCSNHPCNGGSGICFCILGSMMTW